MAIAVPIVATAAALPACALGRLALAYLIAFYCGVTRTESSIVFSVVDASNVKVAAFLVSAIWAAWALS